MMSELEGTRAEILDELLSKHLAGKLTWQPRIGENSYETSIGDFVFHIDRKSVGTKIVYRIWVFDSSGEDLDNFDVSSISNYIPDDTNFETYFKIAQFLYKNVKENFANQRLVPALDKLRSFRADDL